MKTIKLCLVLLYLVFIRTWPLLAQTQIVTLSTTNGGANLKITEMSVSPQSAVTLLAVSISTNNLGYCRMMLTNGTAIYPYANPNQTYGSGIINVGTMTFTGVTNVSLASYSDGAATFSITTPGPPQSYLPANTVVIPTDAAGSVQIILESSADLINWNVALPGTYGTTYSNRFFRVRAVVGP